MQPVEKLISGKVREVYAVGEDSLVIVTTDRISAFDVVLPSAIPGKGAALNRISNFWFDFTRDIVPNHLLSRTLSDMPPLFAQDAGYHDGRTVLVKRLRMLPFEFIVRGYVFGNMWKAYQTGEAFCGQKIEGDYALAQKLERPVITPSTKAEEGHDEYIPLARLREVIGGERTAEICGVCLALFERCCAYALSRGIIIADTKFEFGLDENGTLTLADEVLTPDSSRFWDAAEYRVGESPQSFDKQFVRDWLTAGKLDGISPAPALPQEIIDKTAALYQECARKLIG